MRLAISTVPGRSISGLEGCTSLEELWLGKNKITQIAGISTLVGLKRLDVQSNRQVQEPRRVRVCVYGPRGLCMPAGTRYAPFFTDNIKTARL